MEQNLEVLQKIETTKDLQLFMDANQGLMLNVFESICQMSYPEPTGLVKDFWTSTGAFIGSSISTIILGIMDNTLAALCIGLIASGSFISAFSSFMLIGAYYGKIKNEAIRIYNELITADDSLIKSIERGRFLSNLDVQEEVREALKQLIESYNEMMRVSLGDGTWKDRLPEGLTEDMIHVLEIDLTKKRK